MINHMINNSFNIYHQPIRRIAVGIDDVMPTHPIQLVQSRWAAVPTYNTPTSCAYDFNQYHKE